MDAERSTLTEQFNQSSGSYELVLSAVILGVFGLFLDNRLGITPVLTVVFTALGFIGSGISIYYRYVARMSDIATASADLASATAGQVSASAEARARARAARASGSTSRTGTVDR